MEVSSPLSLEHWLVMALLGLLSALFGFLPYFLMRRLKSWEDVTNKNIYHLTISSLSCLGAGVLLSTTVAHMLPENRFSLEATEFVQENFDSHFPMAEILTLVGFLLIYFLEELANWMMAGQGAILGHGHSPTPSHPISDPNIVERKASSGTINVMSTGTVHVGIVDDNPSSSESVTNSDAQFNNSVARDPKKKMTASQMGAFFAVFALSFHAVMEGIAIGLQNSTNLWLMFGAIASHKFVISFCMGMELCAVRANPKSFIGSITLFSILSPVGILIGSLLTSEDSTKSFPLGVLEGVATGTLLYIIFMEILSREKERREKDLATSRSAGFLQFVALMIGLVAMLGLLTQTAHGHSHGDSDDQGHGHEDDESDHDHDHKALKFKLF